MGLDGCLAVVVSEDYLWRVSIDRPFLNLYTSVEKLGKVSYFSLRMYGGEVSSS
jgi:hypothetical protein